MLLLWVVLLSWWQLGHCANTLVDFQYTYPRCSAAPTAPLNALGDLTLRLDLLGRWLTVTVQPCQTADSCRLCALNASLCNTSFAQLGSALHLLPGAGYNLRLYWLNAAGAAHAVTTSSLNVTTGLLTLTAGAPQPYAGDASRLCGNRYRFVALALLTSEAPVANFYVTLAVQDPSDTVPCDPNASAQGLSCRIATHFPVLELQTSNCLAPATEPVQPPVSTLHSVLYWQRNRDQWPLVPLPRVCGEEWEQVWDAAAPQNYLCNADLALYIKPLPWYEAALETSVALFNAEGALDAQLAWALDVLDNYCAVRQSSPLRLEDSLLYNLTITLRARHLLSLEQECEGLSVERSDALWPYYAQHYDDWQLQAFLYMFPLDTSQPLKVALLIAGLLLTFVVCTGMTLFVLVRLWWRESRHSYGAI